MFKTSDNYDVVEIKIDATTVQVPVDISVAAALLLSDRIPFR